MPQDPSTFIDYPPTAKPTFRLHWPAWLAFALTGALAVILNLMVPPVEPIPYCIGILIGLFLIAILPALLAFFLFRRSRTAATITFLLFLLPGVAGQIADTTARLARQNSINAFNSEATRPAP
jgi:hypothetical protein